MHFPGRCRPRSNTYPLEKSSALRNTSVGSSTSAAAAVAVAIAGAIKAANAAGDGVAFAAGDGAPTTDASTSSNKTVYPKFRSMVFIGSLVVSASPYHREAASNVSSASLVPNSPASRVLGIDELLSMIIGFTDAATTKSCVLCCRRWNAIGRRILWRRLKLIVQPRTLVTSPDRGTHPGRSKSTTHAGFLQRAIATFECTSIYGLEHISDHSSLPKRFLWMLSDTLDHVRHIDLDLVMPLDPSDTGREIPHFLGQVFAAGYFVGACPRLRSMHVRLAHGPVRVMGQVPMPIPALVPALVALPTPAEFGPFDAENGQWTAPAAEIVIRSNTQQQQIDMLMETDILDESDEEVLSINISRMMLPAVRILEAMLRKCRFSPELLVEWKIDMPVGRPAQLLLNGSRIGDDDASGFKTVAVCMTDATGTHPHKLADLLSRMSGVERVSLRGAGLSSTVIGALERHAQNGCLRVLNLPALHALDEDAFFNVFLARSARDLESLDLTNLSLMFRVVMRSPTLACIGLRRLILNGVRDHLHADFFESVAASCPELEELECRDNLHVSDAVVGTIVMQCRRLRRLDVSGCIRLTLSVLGMIADAATMAGKNPTASSLCLRVFEIADVPGVMLENDSQSPLARAIVRLGASCGRLWAVRVSVAQSKGVVAAGDSQPHWWPRPWPKRSKVSMWLNLGVLDCK